MPKLPQGRLSGFNGMTTFTAKELHEWADELEIYAVHDECAEDPRHVMRWAKNIRKLAIAKEKSLENKSE